VPDAAPVLPARGEPLAGELAPGGDVPQAKLRNDAPVGTARDIADDECVGADGAPVRKARSGVDVAHLLQVRAAIERLKETRTAEVGGDHVGDVGGELGIGAEEDGNGYRNRRDGALRLTALQSAGTAAGAAAQAAPAATGGRRRRRLELSHLCVEAAARRRALVAVVGALRGCRREERGDAKHRQRT
jgi:hypothetical protein